MGNQSPISLIYAIVAAALQGQGELAWSVLWSLLQSQGAGVHQGLEGMSGLSPTQVRGPSEKIAQGLFSAVDLGKPWLPQVREILLRTNQLDQRTGFKELY